MTREELRRICDSLNDERGTGGQTELARRLGWNPCTVRRKLAGTSRITRADELAVRAVAGKGEREIGWREKTGL